MLIVIPAEHYIIVSKIDMQKIYYNFMNSATRKNCPYYIKTVEAICITGYTWTIVCSFFPAIVRK